MTMAEYIKREATIKAIVDSRNRYYNSASNQYLVGRCDGLDIAAGLLRVAPAADVAPVVHGLWEEEPSSFWRWTPSGAVVVARTTYRCGLCGRGTAVKSNYCPNCGAKMDGERKDGGDG